MQEEPNDKREEEKTEAQVAQQGDTNKKSTKKKNVKKRSFEVEADRWEEMKREGKVDDCRLWLPLEVEGERTLALYDTGTTRSFCNKEFIRHHNLTRRSTKWSAATQAGTSVEILGEVDVKVKSVRGQVDYTALVVAGGRGILVLSEKDGRKLGIHVVGLLAGFPDERAAIVDDREWVEENTADMREEVKASANELKEIDEIVGPALDKNEKLPKSAVCNRPDAVYSFNIAPDAKTWVWQYPVPAKAKQKVAERLKEWRENGWSKPAVPGNRNNNPLLAVDKKSAGVVAFDDIRLCIDARQLNTLNRTKKRTYVLPRIADILKKAQKATFMADLDLKAAFHQFLLDVRLSELSAFTSPCDSSRQQMTRMWFGEEGASDHCQMIVERVMGLGEEGTEDWDLFVDNLYMFFTGSDIRKFAESVARLIRKFTEAGLKLNRKKCKIGFVRMQVLGFLCEKGQCSVDLNKLECFEKMKKPKGQWELASLLGFTNFLRDQIPLYSRVVGPLQQIASKKNWDKNMWGPDQEAAFSRLKTALLKAPVVHQPDMDKAFHVSTDASQHGVGAVLYQVVNREKKYVSFTSKALKKGQRNYSATKRELLAIVYALKRWEPFLAGTKFSVETDHKALSFLHNAKSHMVRDWARYLSTFDFTVSHIPGADNILPHYLSHLDGLIDEHTHDEEPREAVIAETAHTERTQTTRAHREETSDREPEEDAELESDDNPEMYLRGTEREFVELVLEAEWIKSGEIREKMVTDAHNTLHQGPMGTFRKLLRDGYFWSDMKRDCRRASQKCKQCLRHNVGKRGFLPLQAGTTLLPLEKVHGDLAGPFLTSEGCKYILVLVDAATRFCWLRAMSEITAAGVAREMLHVFSEFGWPSTLVTDGGSNMSKAAVANILALVGAEARVTIPGAHEQNSAAERTIQEVRQAIKKKCDKHPKEWKSFLPVIQMEINERVSERTKSSPFSLMFARRRGVFPGDGKVDQEALERRNANMLEIVYPEVAATAKRNSERACKEANSRRTLTDNVFKPGDLVMHEQIMRSRSQMRYDSPFRVRSFNLTARAYVLENLDSTNIRGGATPHDRLKSFRGDANELKENDKDANEYEISKIHDVRTGENGQEYLVKWKGYKERTWEAEENMEGAGRALELFWDRKEKEDEVKRKPWSTSHEVRPTKK